MIQEFSFGSSNSWWQPMMIDVFYEKNMDVKFYRKDKFTLNWRYLIKNFRVKAGNILNFVSCEKNFLAMVNNITPLHIKVKWLFTYNIAVVNFDCGGKQNTLSKPQTSHMSLTNFITPCHTQLATLAVIDTDSGHKEWVIVV